MLVNIYSFSTNISLFSFSVICLFPCGASEKTFFSCYAHLKSLNSMEFIGYIGIPT